MLCGESLDFLRLKSKEAVESTAELERVVSAVHDVKKGRVHFKSAWGLSQIVLSVLRQSSCKTAPVCHPEIDLLPLLVLGLRVCPLNAAPCLATVVHNCLCGEASSSSLSALASATVCEASTHEESETAVNIVFHYLLTWGHVLNQRKEAVSVFMRCATFVGMCLEELLTCRPSGSEKEDGAARGYCCQWQANLLAYGTTSLSTAKAVLLFIGDQFALPKNGAAESESAPVVVRVSLQRGFEAPGASKHWIFLVHSFLNEAYKRFRDCAKEVEKGQVGEEGDTERMQELSIKELLARMVSQEPPVLGEHFDTPLNIADVEATAHSLHSFCSEGGSAVIDLLEHVLLVVDLSHVVSVGPFREEYTQCFRDPPLYNYVHTTVAVALREGHVESALTLLDKALGSAGPPQRWHRWARRLRRWVNEEPLNETHREWFGAVRPACHDAAPLFSVFARDAALQLSVEDALDILVGPSRVELLRLVCHTILHEPACEWVPQLLHDAYALFFVHEALGRLAVHFVEATDLPLARHYMSSFILCVAHRSTRCSVRLVMRVVGKFATALRGTSGDPKTASFWEKMESCFSPPRATNEVSAREAVTLGRAFDARESFFRFFRSGAVRGSTDLQHARPYTLVEIRAHSSSCIFFKRARYDDCFCTSASNIEVPVVSGDDLHKAFESIRGIAQANKRQLSTTVDDDTPTGALQERRATQLNESPSGRERMDFKRAEKEKWWRRRFELDVELHDAVHQLEVSLGVFRLLLLGELDLPLRLQLQAIGEQLAAGVVGTSAHETASSVQLEKVQSFIALLLQGLPFLYHTPEGCEVKVSSKVRYARYRLLYNPRHTECASCSATKQSLSSFLRLCVESFIDANAHPPAAPPPKADARASACCHYGDAVAACLEAFYTSLESMHMEPAQEHANLRLYPRQHVYLAMDSALQAVPWEALDVTQGQHISRVPSAAYLAAAAQHGEVLRGLDKVHLYGDTHHEATEMERFKSVLQSHPQWSSSTQLPGPCLASRAAEDSSFLTQLLRDSVNLYVFAGHKKGEQLISRAHLYDRFPAARGSFPSALLMGCGSAAVRGGPQCDSYGMPFAYLHAGAPAFVGCLWDVTDGEIDKLTCRLLSSLQERGSLVEALAAARGACKLPYLSAAAAVLYGVDVTFN